MGARASGAHRAGGRRGGGSGLLCAGTLRPPYPPGVVQRRWRSAAGPRTPRTERGARRKRGAASPSQGLLAIFRRPRHGADRSGGDRTSRFRGLVAGESGFPDALPDRRTASGPPQGVPHVPPVPGDPRDLPPLLRGERPPSCTSARSCRIRPDAHVRERRHGALQAALLGEETRDYTRATTSQKCMRVSGKPTTSRTSAGRRATTRSSRCSATSRSVTISRRRRSSTPGSC